MDSPFFCVTTPGVEVYTDARIVLSANWRISIRLMCVILNLFQDPPYLRVMLNLFQHPPYVSSSALGVESEKGEKTLHLIWEEV